MDLKRLRIFREVYRQGGFSSAARRLALTQSAVSQQIKALERELSVLLFEAQDRSRPTPAADYLAREGGFVLAAVDDVRRGIMHVGEIGGGSVRVGMIDTAATELMPEALSAFKRAHPQVHVEAVVKTSGELIEMLERHELDLAIAIANHLPEHLVSQEIAADSIVAVMPLHSPLRRKRLSVRDLRGEPLILYPRSSHSRQVIEEVFRAHGVVPTVEMEMHYPAAILSMVKQGMGIGLISEGAAREQRLRGQAIVPVVELADSRRIGIITHRRRHLAPQARALIDAIVGCHR
jgi:DNA-binding transcriptional LysR family regulator